MKRLTRTIAVAALASTLAIASGCSGADDSKSAGGSGDAKTLEKVTYLTSFANFGRDAYAYVAKDKGYFKEAGFDVDIKPGSGTLNNLKAIATGTAMFTPLDLTGILQARGTGSAEAKEVTVVAGIQQRTMAAIITLDDKGITTPKDLEGKELADSPSSVVRNLFPTYAKLAGVDVSKVTWRDGDPAGLIGLLAGGATQGIGQFVVGKPTVEAAAKGKKAVVLPYSDVMTDLYGNVLVTSNKIAKEDPEKVKRFTAALIKGLVASIDNPTEAGQILNKNVPAAAAAPAAAECELMASFVRSAGSGAAVGTIDIARVSRSIAILQGAGAIPPGLTPEDLIDVNLTPKA
ncbi:ABC transporter substrate-binding protein [Micromonospora sp. NPDC050417]|uniref:ABC transporter substrate-binding protein n=1 Tax=Micromonospora sp. NPDC050417 TaxID=3364280 RepID=UPI0037993FF6